MLTIKRGDTFAFYANITDEFGEPLLVSVDKLKSQVRDTNYKLIAELVIATTEVGGRYLFTAAETNTWPSEPGSGKVLLMDIEINNGGQINSSRTIEINVVKDVTANE